MKIEIVEAKKRTIFIYISVYGDTYISFLSNKDNHTLAAYDTYIKLDDRFNTNTTFIIGEENTFYNKLNNMLNMRYYSVHNIKALLNNNLKNCIIDAINFNLYNGQ